MRLTFLHTCLKHFFDCLQAVSTVNFVLKMLQSLAPYPFRPPEEHLYNIYRVRNRLNIKFGFFPNDDVEKSLCNYTEYLLIKNDRKQSVLSKALKFINLTSDFLLVIIIVT